MAPSSSQTQSFYQTAHLGLRLLEARAPQSRRFGSEAEARWQLLRGHLADTDRLDLLIRDAAVSHPLAFAPREIFPINGLSNDEPFGPYWAGPDPIMTEQLRRTEGTPPSTQEIGAVLRQAASYWDIEPASRALLTDIGPATRILAGGMGAIITLAEAFAGRTGYDIGDQVMLIADHPGDRQVFGLAAALLNATVVRTIAPSTTEDEMAERLRDAGLAQLDWRFVSDDASAAIQEASQRLVAVGRAA